jgi:hypothetical protein
MTKLTTQQLHQLANHLLKCLSMKNKDTRNDVLAFLPDTVRGAISRRDQDRADIVNIVRTCNEYPGALADLVDGVRCYDEDSSGMQKLDTFMHSLRRSAAPHQREAANPNQSYEHVEKQLCRIDFKRAVDIFQTIMKDFGNDGGAMLLLLQDSDRMGGELLLSRMYRTLADRLYPIHRYPINYDLGMSPDKHGILHKLAGYFPPEDTANQSDKYMEGVIDQICKFIMTRKVIFIEFRQCNRFTPHDEMLNWFVQEFWVRLVDKFYATIKQENLRQVRLITTLVSEIEFPEAVLAPHLGCPDPFFSHKILHLPLEKWSLEDIRDWLSSYSALTKGQDIDDAAQKIYEASGGNPRTAATFLLDRFAQRQEQ